MTKKPPSITDIINASAKQFEISVNDMLNLRKIDHTANRARLAAIFAAGKADYSNKDIANAMNYSSENTISSKFEKANISFRNQRSDKDIELTRDVETLAKTLHIPLV